MGLFDKVEDFFGGLVEKTEDAIGGLFDKTDDVVKENVKATSYEDIQDEDNDRYDAIENESSLLVSDIDVLNGIFQKKQSGGTVSLSDEESLSDIGRRYKYLPTGEEDFTTKYNNITDILSNKYESNRKEMDNIRNKIHLRDKTVEDSIVSDIEEFKSIKREGAAEGYGDAFKKAATDNIAKYTNSIASSNDGNIDETDKEFIGKYVSSQRLLLNMINAIPDEKMQELSSRSFGADNAVYQYLLDTGSPDAKLALQMMDDARSYLDLRTMANQADSAKEKFSHGNIGGGLLSTAAFGANVIENVVDFGITKAFQGGFMIGDKETASEKRGVIAARFDGLDSVSDSVLNWEAAWRGEDFGMGASALNKLNKATTFIAKNTGEAATLAIGAEAVGTLGLPTIISKLAPVAGILKKTRAINSVVSSRAVEATARTLYSALTDGLVLEQVMKSANGDESNISARDLTFMGAMNLAGSSLFHLVGGGFKYGKRLLRGESLADTSAEVLLNKLQKMYDDGGNAAKASRDIRTAIAGVERKALKKGEELSIEDVQKIIRNGLDKQATRSVKSQLSVMESIVGDEEKASFMRLASQMEQSLHPSLRRANSLEAMSDTASVTGEHGLVRVFDEWRDSLRKDSEFLTKKGETGEIADLEEELAKMTKKENTPEDVEKMMSISREISNLKSERELSLARFQADENLTESYRSHMLDMFASRRAQFFNEMLANANIAKNANKSVLDFIEKVEKAKITEEKVRILVAGLPQSLRKEVKEGIKKAGKSESKKKKFVESFLKKRKNIILESDKKVVDAILKFNTANMPDLYDVPSGLLKMDGYQISERFLGTPIKNLGVKLGLEKAGERWESAMRNFDEKEFPIVMEMLDAIIKKSKSKKPELDMYNMFLRMSRRNEAAYEAGISAMKNNKRITKNYVKKPGEWGVNELLRYLVGEVNTKGRSVFRRQIRKKYAEDLITYLKDLKKKKVSPEDTRNTLYARAVQAQKEGADVMGNAQKVLDDLEKEIAETEGKSLEGSITLFRSAGDNTRTTLQSLKNLAKDGKLDLVMDVRIKEMDEVLAEAEEMMRSIPKKEAVNMATGEVSSTDLFGVVEKSNIWRDAAESGLYDAEDEIATGIRNVRKEKVGERVRTGDGNKNEKAASTINKIIMGDSDVIAVDPEDLKKNVENILTYISDTFKEGESASMYNNRIADAVDEAMEEYGSRSYNESQKVMKSMNSFLLAESYAKDILDNVAKKKSLDFLIPTSGRKISAEIDVAEANMAKEFQAVGILGGKSKLFGVRTYQKMLDTPLTKKATEKIARVNKALDDDAFYNKRIKGALKELRGFRLAGENGISGMMKEYSEELERINLMSKVEYAQEIEDVFGADFGKFVSKERLAARSVAKRLSLFDMKEGRTLQKLGESKIKALSSYMEHMQRMRSVVKNEAPDIAYRSLAHTGANIYDPSSFRLDEKNLLGDETFFDNGIVSFRSEANLALMDTYVTIGAGEEMSFGRSVLEDMFGKYDVNDMYKDLSLQKFNWAHGFLNMLGAPVATVFTKTKQFAMATQDAQRMWQHFRAIEKQLKAIDGVSFRDEEEAVMKFAEKYGGVSTPNVKLGGKFGKDGSFFNSTSRGGGVLDGFHDGRIAADIGEDAADLGEAIETGGALSAIRKRLGQIDIDPKSLGHKARELYDKADVVDAANGYAARKMHALFVMDNVARTPFKTVSNLLRSVEEGDKIAEALAESVWKRANERARISTTNLIGVDQGNVLMRSPFARRMFMFSFFSTWASRMLGHVSSQLLDPTLRTFRFLKRGDISGAASTLQKTFENQEFRALMGGLINSYRDMYIIQSSLGADDRSLDSFWAFPGQSTAYLAPALFPGTRFIIDGYRTSEAYDDLDESYKKYMGPDAKIKAVIANLLNSLTASFLSQARSYVKGVTAAASYESHFTDASTTDFFLNAFGKEFLRETLSSSSRIPGVRISGLVTSVPTERLMATENTNIMADLFMTPEVNRYNEAMGVIEDLLYQTAEGQREGVFMTAINSILSNAVFQGLDNAHNRLPKAEMGKRIQEVWKTAPVQMIVNDPVQAFREGYLGDSAVQIVKNHIESGKLSPDEELLLASANGILADDEFQYILNGKLSGLKDMAKDYISNQGASKVNAAYLKEQLKAFNDKLGGGTLAARYFYNELSKDLVNDARKASKDEDGNVTLSITDENELIRNILFLFGSDLGAEKTDSKTVGGNGSTPIEMMMRSDKTLVAELASDYIARNIGWKYGLDADGNDKASGSSPLTSEAPAMAAKIIVMRNLYGNEYGADAKQAFSNSIASLMQSISPVDTPEANNQYAAVLSAVANEVNMSAAPLSVKKDINKAIIYSNLDKMDRILDTVPGKNWEVMERKDIAELAAFLYTEGSGVADDDDGSGKKKKVKAIAQKARKYLDAAKKEVPELKTRDYSPESYERASRRGATGERGGGDYKRGTVPASSLGSGISQIDEPGGSQITDDLSISKGKSKTKKIAVKTTKTIRSRNSRTPG